MASSAIGPTPGFMPVLEEEPGAYTQVLGIMLESGEAL